MGRRKINIPVDDIISDYRSGINLHELSEKYSVSYATIRTRLIVAEILIPKKRANDAQTISEIWIDYEAGMILADLAKKYGVSMTTIHRRLKEEAKCWS